MTDSDQRLTFVPFALPDAEKVRAAFAASERPLVCPRCESELDLGEPIVLGDAVGKFWLVRCSGCRRSLRVTEPPETPAAGEDG